MSFIHFGSGRNTRHSENSGPAGPGPAEDHSRETQTTEITWPDKSPIRGSAAPGSGMTGHLESPETVAIVEEAEFVAPLPSLDREFGFLPLG
jgi:hypothetical protein